MKRAMYYENTNNDQVLCLLCPHNCLISPGKTGICKVRKNVNGTLYSLNYGQVTSIALDPIEKKPLYHFYPGSNILSVGTFGCNLSCTFCQNWGIAHELPQSQTLQADALVETAIIQENNIGIAYTYNEPSIWYEYVLDTAKKANSKGLKNVLVTNGYIEPKPLNNILPYIDAMNIDVKAFTEQYYSDICGATLEDVKSTVEIAAQTCHVEITTLIVPGLNDSIEEIGSLSNWLANINKDIPLHLSRYFPNYKMTDKQPTPIETLKKLHKEAKKHLNFVYIGNV